MSTLTVYRQISTVDSRKLEKSSNKFHVSGNRVLSIPIKKLDGLLGRYCYNSALYHGIHMTALLQKKHKK